MQKKISKNIFSIWLKRKPAHSLKEALATSRLRALNQNIKDALRFLRKTHLKSLFYRQKLPWYLVFGASNAGKTSLLATSGLDLVSTNQLPVQHIATTTYCQWFFGKEAVFIDTSGSLMLPEHIDTATLNLWKKFIALLYRYRHFHPLDGAILCIDLLDFQDKSFEQRRQYVDVLLHHIQAFPYPIPVYILFTRCDRVQGFSEFFHALSTEEREQICGMTLPFIEQQDFAPYLDEQFNNFLLRLNQQVLACMQRERHLQKRARIKNFPLQLEAQKRSIIQLNNQLHSTRNPIKGIYFTSSQQEGVQNDALSPLLDTFGFPAVPNTSDRPLQKNAFFIKNVLKKIIQHKKNTLTPSKNIFQKILKPVNSPKFYLITGGVFVTLFLLTLSSYFYNRQAIYQVHMILADYQNQQRAKPQEDPLALLNTLQKGQDEVKHASNPFTGLVFHQAKFLKAQLDTLYSQALDNTFVPKLEKILETQLQTDIQKKSPGLFDTLRVYLMMSDPPHRDLKFIDAWFATTIQNISATDQKTAQKNTPFMRHLHLWLAQKPSTFKTDTKLVSSARETLQKGSPKDLVYAHLEQKYQRMSQEAKIISPNSLYATKNFQTVSRQDIPALSEQILKNDAWVLGEAVPSSMIRPLISQLADDVRQLYVTRYVAFWTAQLSNLAVPRFNDLNEARLFASTLNTDRSLLVEPLNIIQKNLEPVATTSEGKKALAQLGKMRELLTTHQQHSKTEEAIKKLVVYLDEILASKNSTSAAFSLAQKRMQNHDKDAITQLITAAREAPAPIDHWLNQLAVNTWQTMLLVSQNHLNTLWRTEILPKYHAEISNRYPVFKDALDEEIELDAFSQFFGPDGDIEKFFKHNLSAFVDTSTLYWQWKNIDGAQLDIPQSTLEMFNRASLIRKMYFAGNEAAPSVRFSLTPVNIELISDNFLLNLGNQSISYTSDFRQSKHVTWPGKKSGYAALKKQEADQNKIFYEEKGNWALFRLLGHANLATSHNPKLYQLEFDLDDQQVTYDLLADNPVNAFLPDILAAFRCPERL